MAQIRHAMKGSPVLIRYADDFVVHCHTRQQALEVKARLAAWLTPRGLAFNEDKTQVVSLSEGYDFLGFNVRRYRAQAADQTQHSGRQTNPEKAPRRAALPAREQRSGGDQTAQPDHPRMGRLLPDTGIRRRLRQAGPLPVAAHLQVGQTQPREQADGLDRSPGTSARSTRPGKTGGCSATAPAAATSTASPGPTSSDTRSSSTAASPDDPELADYWAWRRHKAPLPINRTALRLYRAQDGRCAICKTTLLAASDRPQTPRDWEHWLATTRKTIDVVWNTANSDAAAPRLIHLHCNHHPPATSSARWYEG